MYLILLLTNLILKLVLINWNGAEYTDSVFYLSFDQIGHSKWLPVYPVLVQFMRLFALDATVTGRLTAILMSTLTLIPLYAITKRLHSKRAGLYAMALYIVAPVVTRWSIRVMTESSFTFLVLMALWFLIRWIESRGQWYGVGAIICTGLAALTRAEGMALLPVAALVTFLMIRHRKLLAIGPLALGWLPWLFQAFWHWQVVGRYGYGKELEGGIRAVGVVKYLTYTGLYVAYLPYIVTPFVLAAIIYGAWKNISRFREDAGTRAVYVFTGYMLLAWLLALPLHWAWTTRFFFPIVVLVLMFAGAGIACLKRNRRQWTALGVCCITSIAMTATVLVCSRATFGDIRAAAYFVRDHVASETPVLSAEGTKMRFWSERQIDGYRHDQLKPGTVVVLQNVYSDDERELEYLHKHFRTEILYQKVGTVVPILADEMYLRPHKRKDGTMVLRGGSNHPIPLAIQFGKHRFRSTVVLLEEQVAAN